MTAEIMKKEKDTELTTKRMRNKENKKKRWRASVLKSKATSREIKGGVKLC